MTLYNNNAISIRDELITYLQGISNYFINYSDNSEIRNI